MSLTISSQLLQATTCEALKAQRQLHQGSRMDREYEVSSDQLEEADLNDIAKAAQKLKDTKTVRAVEAILGARKGLFARPIPNFKAFEGMLKAFLKQDLIDGWIYVRGNDGKLYPELVTSVSFDDGKAYRGAKGPPTVWLHTAIYSCPAHGASEEVMGSQTASHSFTPQEVTNRRISDVLESKGIFKETPALKKEYEVSLKRHRELIQPAFAKQFRMTGKVFRFEQDNWQRRGTLFENRKVIHDLDSEEYGAYTYHTESCLFSEDSKSGGVGQVPEHPLVRVFDLVTHDFLWVNSDHLTPYVYDKRLRDKLILPQSHRDLLDVLTTDLDAFIDDIIEGKSAGNVILCKGPWGTGKTLSAEIYAELIERPLYSVRTGNLGTNVEEVEKNLQVIFQRAKRWNCVLLLDEADVFIVRRGNSIEQNAIVAEFLRTLEYFDGLLFMTTNRPDDIDEAIMSRCAAIVEYAMPAPEDAAKVWKVMADQFEAKLKPTMIRDLVALFPEISARDIKMLFRLALRVSRHRKIPLTLDVFRQCAMFRAIKIAE